MFRIIIIKEIVLYVQHLSIQILSNSVAKGLRFYNAYHHELEDSTATIEFCEWINSMFDSLNRKEYQNGLKPGNKDYLVRSILHYVPFVLYSEKQTSTLYGYNVLIKYYCFPILQFLLESLQKLDQWENLMEEGTITNNEFLTRQTSEGLRVTLQSMIDTTSYLTSKFNFQCILSGNIKQDALEVCFIRGINCTMQNSIFLK